MSRFEIHGERRVVFRDALGKPMFLSGEYAGAVACRAAIATIRMSAVLPDRYEQRIASDGATYFVLRGMDDSVLGSSAHYENADICARAIDAMRSDAASALVVHVPSAGGAGPVDIKLTRQSGFVVVATDPDVPDEPSPSDAATPSPSTDPDADAGHDV
ncbi:MAG TPA: DUF1508 domain-containing protein [Nannocystaceae bacterium]|nr:DUF1508 domain-containing protein [Nannocystaceae bacterium]